MKTTEEIELQHEKAATTTAKKVKSLMGRSNLTCQIILKWKNITIIDVTFPRNN